MAKSRTIELKGNVIAVINTKDWDFISLTDMVKGFGDDSLVYSWMRNRNTVEFLGIWEELNNPNFKGDEFVTFKMQAGLNNFNLTPRKWIEATQAIGIVSKAGRYGGGTFAHKDIAFEFGSWLSPEFKLYLIKEFQRLKDEENKRLSLDWDLHRTLAKVNYRIHTDSIKENIIPPTITKEQANAIYASEADVLNVAMFGKTAQQWRKENSGKKGNVRDHSTIQQLLVLANLESMNAELIRLNLPQTERLKKLNDMAIAQLKSLASHPITKTLSKKPGK